MNKDILKQVGITEQEFNELKNDWKEKHPYIDAHYLKSPEGKLMGAIYGGK